MRPYAKLAAMLRTPAEIARDNEYDRLCGVLNKYDRREMRKFTNKDEAIDYARMELNTVWRIFGVEFRKYE